MKVNGFADFNIYLQYTCITTPNFVIAGFIPATHGSAWSIAVYGKDGFPQ
jgi:hypothetical protein